MIDMKDWEARQAARNAAWEIEVQRRRRKRRIVTWLIIAGGSLVVMVAVGVAICARTGDAHENGYSIGTLINVRHEGMLWSRPAATLLHSGEMKGDEFGMEPSLYEAAMKYADRRQRVKVGYADRFQCWAWNYANCRFIVSIEPDPAP